MMSLRRATLDVQVFVYSFTKHFLKAYCVPAPWPHKRASRYFRHYLSSQTELPALTLVKDLLLICLTGCREFRCKEGSSPAL